MTAQAAAHPAGQVVRCPTCHRVQVCVGGEITIICHDRHRAVAMQIVRDATSTERRAG